MIVNPRIDMLIASLDQALDQLQSDPPISNAEMVTVLTLALGRLLEGAPQNEYGKTIAVAVMNVLLASARHEPVEDVHRVLFAVLAVPIAESPETPETRRPM